MAHTVDNIDLGFGVDESFTPSDFNLRAIDDDMLAAALDLPESTLPPSTSILTLVPEHQKLHPWPPRLPLDIVLALEPESDILAKHNVDPDQYELLKLSEPFRRELAEAQKFIREEGFTFRRKCQAIAEDWLPELDSYLHMAHIPFKDKLEALKIVTKLGNLEPKDAQTQSAGTMVQIQINL